MGFLTAGHLRSSTEGPESQPETIAAPRGSSAPARPTVDANERLEHLAQSELMLRAAIEALSPDKDEIRKRLSGTDAQNTTEGQRAMNSRLVLAVIVLIFLILAFDLLLTGG